MPRALLVALFANLLAGYAWADTPKSPMPSAPKHIEPRVRFIGIEKQLGYVFIMTYASGDDQRSARPMRLLVINDKELKLKGTGRYIGSTKLLAISRRDFDKLRGGKGSKVTVDERTPGVLTAAMSAPTSTLPFFSQKAPLTEYRVSINNGKLDASRVWNLRGETAPRDGQFGPSVGAD